MNLWVSENEAKQEEDEGANIKKNLTRPYRERSCWRDSSVQRTHTYAANRRRRCTCSCTGSFCSFFLRFGNFSVLDPYLRGVLLVHTSAHIHICIHDHDHETYIMLHHWRWAGNGWKGLVRWWTSHHIFSILHYAQFISLSSKQLLLLLVSGIPAWSRLPWVLNLSGCEEGTRSSAAYCLVELKD